jgi:hypothetical protein
MDEIDAAPKPKEKEFKRYLESCSNNNFVMIEAVMYGGMEVSRRIDGRTHPLDEMLQINYGDRESRLRAITERWSLHRFLAAGIKAYK